MNRLKGILDKETMEECMIFIKAKRESRHIRTQRRQRSKFNPLCHKNTGGRSNHLHGIYGKHDEKQHETLENTTSTPVTTTTVTGPNPQRARWDINISSRPLITVQESLVACGPNFAVVPRGPPLLSVLQQ